MRYNKKIDSIYRTSLSPTQTSEKIRMHSGERTTEFAQDFIKAFISKITSNTFSVYPDVSRLKEKIALMNGVSPSNVFISHGSDYSLAALFYAFVESGTYVVMPEARFPMYDVYLQQSSGSLLEIPYAKDRDTLYLDTKNAPTACGDVRLVVVGNPNSPVGDALPIDSLASLEKYDCPIVVDQAYAEFGCTDIPIKKMDAGYVFVNTFSKAYGAAGIRVGYTIASQEIIEKMNKFRMMFEVSSVSLLFAEHLLDNEHVKNEYVATINEEKEKLEEIGIRTQLGNWVHLDQKYGEVLTGYTYKDHCSLPMSSSEFIKIGIFPGLHKILLKSSVHTP